MELVKAFAREELGGTKVEVWIKLMDDALKAKHRKQASREGWFEGQVESVRRYNEVDVCVCVFLWVYLPMM